MCVMSVKMRVCKVKSTNGMYGRYGMNGMYVTYMVRMMHGTYDTYVMYVERCINQCGVNLPPNDHGWAGEGRPD